MKRYRIKKINDICPWQVQERKWLFWWKGKYQFSSIKTAEAEIVLLNADRLLGK